MQYIGDVNMKENSIIKIGTVNLQNNKTNRMGGLRPDGIDTSSLVSTHIETEQFDILGNSILSFFFFILSHQIRRFCY